jgi:DNA-binding transcriptional LysR family regulator
MQLESLKVFCDVARLQSFSLAAAENHLSQSAASQIVIQLEKRLNVQLIDRSFRPPKPTREGEVFWAGCKAIIEQYQELEASIRDAQRELVGNVQVAAIYSVGLGDMGEYIEQFAKQYPEAKIRMEYLHPDRVYEKILEGAADLGLVSFPRESRELAVLPWREERMVLACAPTHPLANQSVVRPAQLHGQKYIGFSKELVIRREVDRYLRRNKVAVEITAESDTIENIKQAVEVSTAVALLPEPTFRREVQTGTLVAVPLAGRRFVRPLGILHRRQIKLGTLPLRFIELLQNSGTVPAPAPVNSSTIGSGVLTRVRTSGVSRGRNVRPSKKAI